MGKPLQAVRGMNDVLPEAVGAWQHIESAARRVLGAYGYREVRLPLVESTELFARSIGAATDIVEKEMYTFADRNGDSLTLRPEGTAGCVRAAIEHGLLHGRTERLWYAGPMFRHERPQRGRYRQFHQIGAEAFGMAGPDLDAELILLSARLWQELGVADLTLELNSLGTPEARANYRDVLAGYLRGRIDELDEDSRRRLETNTLRVLDSKAPGMVDVIREAPSLFDHLDPESLAHFEGLRGMLDATGLSYRVNPRLVRGLDYYTRTVFEWVHGGLGAQNTVCAGGRYDGLVEQLGGKSTPAAGFALGLERLVELLGPRPEAADAPHAYLVVAHASLETEAVRVAERLRGGGLRVLYNCGLGSLKSQMRRADRSGAFYAVIVGEEELAAGAASVRDLRGDAPQVQVPLADLAGHLRARLDNC